VLASQPPVKPDPITTEINNLFVRVAWTAYPLVTQFEVGGETIITYNLQWDEGTNGVSWKDVQGQESIPSLTTTA